MPPITRTTKLSELRALLALAEARAGEDRSVPDRMLRSVEQSMRVEGYTMSPDDVLRGASEPLKH